MGGIARVLAIAGRSGGLPALTRWAFERTGFVQALTTSATVTAFLNDLDHPGVTVPYHERSELLGVGDFPLALDGTPHDEARELIKSVLRKSAGAHRNGVAAAADLAQKRVATASDRLDLIERVVDPALQTWTQTWYGLPDWGARLMLAGRLIHHGIFLNPKAPSGRTDFAALRHAIDAVDHTLVQLTKHLATSGSLPAGSVAAKLLSRTNDPQLTARHLLGLTVGPLALGSQAIANVFDELLDCSWKLDGLTPRPGETVVEARRRAEQLFVLALAHRPPLPGVARQNPTAFDLPGTGGCPVAVPRGDVLVATEAAMALDPLSPDLAFGHGRHGCLGQEQITEVAGALLVAVASRSPRRISGPAGKLTGGPMPTGFAAWPFPGHLDVSLLG